MPKHFSTKAAAEAEARTMAGWDIEIVDYQTLEGEHCYVILAKAYGAHGGFGCLHDDGFVR